MKFNTRNALTTVCAALLLCLVCSRPALAERPNIVLIVADDLGYGDLGCYGQQNILTPNIDRIAAEGLRFTDFYAGSTVCAPSRCVLMTGLHTGHCYIRGNGKIDLRPEDTTFAERLREAGYRTGAFGKWGLGKEGSTGSPIRKGFEEFFGYVDQTHAHNYYPSFLVHNDVRVKQPNVVPNEGPYGQGVATLKQAYSHDLIMQAALDWVDDVHAGPFFLYLPLTIPHANNQAGKDGMEVPDLGPYADREWPKTAKEHAAMVTRMDTGIGELLALLKQHGIDEQTLVCFTSDNGPHREGGNNPDFHDSNGPLRGIKRDLYEGGIRVPLIIRWPARIKAGTETDFIGSFADFYPTFCEVAGVETTERLDGLSFLPTLIGQPDEQQRHDALYWEFYEGGSKQAVRMGDWKVIVRPMFSENAELYNLSNDISEKTNIAQKHPDVVARGLKMMRAAHTPNPLWKVRNRRPRKSSSSAP